MYIQLFGKHSYFLSRSEEVREGREWREGNNSERHNTESHPLSQAQLQNLSLLHRYVITHSIPPPFMDFIRKTVKRIVNNWHDKGISFHHSAFRTAFQVNPFCCLLYVICLADLSFRGISVEQCGHSRNFCLLFPGSLASDTKVGTNIQWKQTLVRYNTDYEYSVYLHHLKCSQQSVEWYIFNGT